VQPPIDNSLQLSIIIPAFNEARRLPPTVVDMLDFLEGRGDRYEIIIVNDGSSDATSSVVKKLQRLSSKVLLIEQPRNFGKGRAVKTGVLQARGTTILMADADGATPFSEIMRLEQAIANGADVAIGSRALESPETQISTSIHRKVMGRIFNGIVNLLLVPDISDTQCGFKLFTYRAAQFLFQRLRSERFSFDVELLFLARNAGMQVSEIPINWHNVPDSKISLIRDSAEMFRDILRFYFWHRDVTPEKWEDFEPIHQEHGLR
jgi:dolichyl-phosphate beta-glucosyltransferase